MQVTSSYGVEIRKQNIPIRHTLRIYRSAVSYLIQVYTQAWGELSEIPNAKKRFMRRSIWFMGQRRTRPVTILTCIFQSFLRI